MKYDMLKIRAMPVVRKDGKVRWKNIHQLRTNSIEEVMAWKEDVKNDT